MRIWTRSTRKAKSAAVIRFILALIITLFNLSYTGDIFLIALFFFAAGILASINWRINKRKDAKTVAALLTNPPQLDIEAFRSVADIPTAIAFLQAILQLLEIKRGRWTDSSIDLMVSSASRGLIKATFFARPELAILNYAAMGNDKRDGFTVLYMLELLGKDETKARVEVALEHLQDIDATEE